jgi:hypothetical protein
VTPFHAGVQPVTLQHVAVPAESVYETMLVEIKLCLLRRFSNCTENPTEWKQLSAWVLREVLSEILDWETQVSPCSLYDLSNNRWTLIFPRLVSPPD